ncbi:hypothetical protein BpHYR1_034789, partial [Brachionus plicatilis]
DELEIVLNKTGKEKEEKYEQLARLDLALRFQEKPILFYERKKKEPNSFCGQMITDYLNTRSTKTKSYPYFYAQIKKIELDFSGQKSKKNLFDSLKLLLVQNFY